MKKTLVLMSMALAVFFLACSNPGGSDSGDGKSPQQSSGITFSDGLPPGSWILYVTSRTVNSPATYFAMAGAGDHVATAASSSVSGTTAALTEMPGRSFDGNGTYTLVLTFSGTSGVKYAPSVQFTGGNAVIAFGAMGDITL